jgi:hypothetical protein
VVKVVDHDIDTLGNLNTINVGSGVLIAISNVNRMRQASYRGFSSKNRKEASPMGKLKSFLLFLTGPYCQFRGVGQSMKRT